MSDSPILHPANVLAPAVIVGASPAAALPPEPVAWPGDLGELLAQCVRQFEKAESLGAANRALTERDVDYYLGNQWTAEERRILDERGQPALTQNYIRRKIDLLLGLERRARSDPKAFPRTQTEEARADAATQVLRYLPVPGKYDGNVPYKKGDRAWATT